MQSLLEKKTRRGFPLLYKLHRYVQPKGLSLSTEYDNFCCKWFLCFVFWSDIVYRFLRFWLEKTKNFKVIVVKQVEKIAYFWSEGGSGFKEGVTVA